VTERRAAMAKRDAQIETVAGRHVGTLRVDADATPGELKEAAQEWLAADGWDADTWPGMVVRSGRTEVRAA
jgi:hypothetical protein